MVYQGQLKSRTRRRGGFGRSRRGKFVKRKRFGRLSRRFGRGPQFAKRVERIVEDRLSAAHHYIQSNATSMKATAINCMHALSLMMGGNADFNSIESLATTDPTVGGSTNQKNIVLAQCRQHFQVTNQANVPVYLDIYWITARHDLAIATNQSDPAGAFWNGINDQAGTALTATTITQGYDPFQVEKFTKNYKVLRKQTVLFHAGATKEFTKVWKYTRNLKASDEDFNINMRKYYRGVMLVLRPCILNDNATHIGTPSAPTLDIFDHRDYKWYLLASYNNDLNLVNNLGALATAGQTTLEATDATAQLVATS